MSLLQKLMIIKSSKKLLWT